MPDSSSVPTLTDRVVARVREAGLAIDRKSGATRSKARRRATDDSQTPAQLREARALKRVFLDLGDSYRSYRRRSGEPVAPEVRSAADRFRRERDLKSLVSVAASLEQLDAMTW